MKRNVGSLRSARAAPAIIAAGPASPPMASIAIRGPAAMVRPVFASALGRDDFAAVIVAAGRAHVVRQLQFAAIGAFLERGGLQPMMAAAHVPLRRRGFSLRDSHCGTFEIFGTTIKIATICASSRQGSFWGFSAGGGRIVANRGPYSAWVRCCKRAVGMQRKFAGGSAYDARSSYANDHAR